MIWSRHPLLLAVYLHNSSHKTGSIPSSPPTKDMKIQKMPSRKTKAACPCVQAGVGIEQVGAPRYTPGPWNHWGPVEETSLKGGELGLEQRLVDCKWPRSMQDLPRKRGVVLMVSFWSSWFYFLPVPHIQPCWCFVISLLSPMAMTVVLPAARCFFFSLSVTAFSHSPGGASVGASGLGGFDGTGEHRLRGRREDGLSDDLREVPRGVVGKTRCARVCVFFFWGGGRPFFFFLHKYIHKYTV